MNLKYLVPFLFLLPNLLFAHSPEAYGYATFMLGITVPFVYYLLDRKLLLLNYSHSGRLHLLITNIVLMFVSIALLYIQLTGDLNFYLSFFSFALVFKITYYSILLKLKLISFLKFSGIYLLITIIAIFIEFIVSSIVYILFQ